MCKSIGLMLGLVMFASLSMAAQSENSFYNERDGSPSAYTCHLDGYIEGWSIAIGIGGQYIRGDGVLTCKTDMGEVTEIPVKLKLIGAGIGLEVSHIQYIGVHTAGVSVSDPNEFYRRYSLGATAGATLINAGVSFDVALSASAKGGPSFELGFTGQEAVGLGVHLYGMGFQISRR